MKREFKSIGALISTARIKQGVSQEAVALLIGYKNGQFISNVERGKCSIPATRIIQTCRVLQITSTNIKEAMIHDYRRNLNLITGTL